MARVARVIPVISYKYLQHPIYRMYNPICYIMLYLFVGFNISTPLKNMSSSVGKDYPIYPYMIYGKKKHVPNHQPVMFVGLSHEI